MRVRAQEADVDVELRALLRFDQGVEDEVADQRIPLQVVAVQTRVDVGMTPKELGSMSPSEKSPRQEP
jgi:hypothetical protein